jgi:IrrE N-terminal-like domain
VIEKHEFTGNNRPSVLSSDFRRYCEHIATRERYALGLRAFDSLPAQLLVNAYQAIVLTVEQLPGIDPALVEQVARQPGWSAALLSRTPFVILHNAAHSPARQQANLMHEFAHYFLRHPAAAFDPATGQLQIVPLHEKEASYLGSCLQIPLRGMTWALQRGWTETQIAAHFGASIEVVRWRHNVTTTGRKLTHD